MKINFTGEPPVSHEDMLKHRQLAIARGLPFVKDAPIHDRPLAVVGGGPSIQKSVAELLRFDGEIWAINGACRWLRDQGIESTFFSVDPHPIVASWVPGAKKALLVSRSDPSVFDALEGADVQIFDSINDDPKGIVGGSSTATVAFVLGWNLGFRKIVFYGCDGSYANGASHAYMDEKREDLLLVECGGKEYLTAPDFYVQSQELSAIIKKAPKHFSEKSGGLLRALVENDSHDVTKASRALCKHMTPCEPQPEGSGMAKTFDELAAFWGSEWAAEKRKYWIKEAA